MKNLTQTQQQIVNSIIDEFESFNAPISESKHNDLIAYINGAIDEKQKFADEIKLTDMAYDKANVEKVTEYINQLNALLNQFGYQCDFEYESRLNNKGFAEYFTAKIIWNGHSVPGHSYWVEKTSIFFYANQHLNDGIWYLKDSSIIIQIDHDRTNRMNSLDELLQCVATMIIKKKKSKIK
jgi:hypothetical protein